jgi:hypothetical protein
MRAMQERLAAAITAYRSQRVEGRPGEKNYLLYSIGLTCGSKIGHDNYAPLYLAIESPTRSPARKSQVWA